MPPVTTAAIILSTAPYRESSCIVYLYTHALGLIHGVAKGVKAGGRAGIPVERGLEIECVVYHKAQVSLCTLGTLTLTQGHEPTRRNLLKSALRDTAFETSLKVIHGEEPNVELFSFFTRFLEKLDLCATPADGAVVLWQFLNGFSRLIGFGCSLTKCCSCGSALGERSGPFLIERGGVACPDCTPPGTELAMLSPAERALIRGKSDGDHRPGGAQLGRITRLLTEYCLFHGESRLGTKACEFLCSLFETGSIDSY